MEKCYCGRSGGFEDRIVVVDGEGREVLACRYCGHTDDLGWLSETNRKQVIEGARRREQTGFVA